MSNNLDKTAQEFFNSEQGSKFASKRGDIEKLADSAEGRKVKGMLENSNVDLMGALNRGDTATLQAALSNVLSTKEGAKIASALSELLGK